MADAETHAMLARITALEEELAAVKQRLDEPLSDAHMRRVRQFFDSRQNQRLRILGNFAMNQPTLFLGQGEIIIGDRVQLGYHPSPFLLSGYIYVEARTKAAVIEIGAGVFINNNCVMCSEGAGISIGSDTLVGTNVEIIDTDGHDLAPSRRMSGRPKTGKVTIGRNVFIGSNVKIMKSVTVGDDTVIANGSIVTRSLPAGVVAGGNPAKPLRSL
jgi:maltose O-acetyltransferase